MTLLDPQSSTISPAVWAPAAPVAGPGDASAWSPRPSGPPVRVLHVVNGEHYAGAERVQDLLAERLPDFGFEAGFACLKRGCFAKERRAQATPLYDVSMRSKLDLAAALRVGRIVRREGYRLIHAHTPRTAMVGRLAASWTGSPLVYHVHSPSLRDSTHRWRNRLNSIVERLSLSGARRLITVSASLARHMERQGCGAERISVVPNGVPQLDVVPHRRPPDSHWTLGAAALFRPRKGLEVLLDALALLRQRSLPVRLRAVGPFESAEYEAEIKDRVASLELGNLVNWTGYARDMNAELAQMDLFVLPSLFGEGLPMVILEAMAAGVPVVATCVEGVPEAVRDGIDGVLARPGDADDLARAVTRVVRGDVDWSQLRSSAIRRQAERFSDRSMAAGVAAAYQLVLAETGAA